MRWIKYIRKKWFKKRSQEVYLLEDLNLEEREERIEAMQLSSKLNKNISMISELYGNSFDLSIRRCQIGVGEVDCALVYMSGLVDNRTLEEILKNIEVDLQHLQDIKTVDVRSTYEFLKNNLLQNRNVKEVKKPYLLVREISLGNTAIILAGVNKVLLCETIGVESRNITEPEAELSLRGPRDGFIENIYTNTSLLRKRIRVPHLWIQEMEIGALSASRVAVAYMKGLASEELVAEVKSRLEEIDIDCILESGYILEYLRDQPLSVFPLIKTTERPDKVISCLMEGKVAVLTDNTPFVLLMPTNYNMFLQAPDDYYAAFPVGFFIRLLRHTAFLIALLLPGFYVAIIGFHTELIPIQLLLQIQAARQGVPFPILLESLLMETVIEILREAGLRLPRAIGSAISIVGALVVGEAAINAGIVSPAMVIIVAVTAIASFTNPSYMMATAIRIMRFGFIILGGALGLFGIQFGLILLLIHLTTLRSFGQPYLQPIAPLIWQDMKDFIIRFPWWKQIFRPKLLGGKEPQRQDKKQRPQPPEGKNDEK